MKNILFAALIAVSALPMTARAQDHSHMQGMKDNPFMAGHEKMMKDMNVKTTGDVDQDFVAMMIPHHQGAIDMAKVVIEKGKDPEIRKLAEDIVKAQESEIKMMQEWQKKRASK
jgi:uncharacterized protein (DUF305 family)